MRIAVLLAATAALSAAEWPQFGGPNRNFTVADPGIAASWPADGPGKLWSRPLGEGYSGIVTDGSAVYTMFRRGNQEVVTALDLASGKTRWEFAYDAPFAPTMKMENGAGPHSTPLVMGNTLYTIGILARLHAIDTKTGKPRWTKDLWKDFPGSTPMDRGYSASPLLYENTLILKLGGHNHAIVALSPKDGSLIWQKHDWANAPASPVIIDVGGQQQLVTFFDDEVMGLDPKGGELLWSHSHPTNWRLNIASPVFGPDNVLFISSAYSGGSKGLKLTRNGAKTSVAQLWASNRMRLHFTNALRIGDHVYGSSGDFGPSPLTAVDVNTGKVAWQDRTFSKANLVMAGSKIILLDEDGTLALVNLSPQGMKVMSKASVLASNAWTGPSLSGTVLYVRDRKNIAAFELK